MSLSCSCPDSEEAEWYYEEPNDFITFQMHRRKRCSSCDELIDKGALCLKFLRWHDPKDEGDEIPIAPLFMCEKCGDQFFNLTALGFCVTPKEDMFELLNQYIEDYAPRKET